jgi:ribosomal protein S18 acetylase RimI-like enzyme
MQIRVYEELMLNAWVSLSTRFYDGWILRFSNGHSHRGNSVHPLYSSALNIEAKIDFCEQVYRAAGLPPMFKLFPDHDDLDSVLTARGYVVEGKAFVQDHRLDKPVTAPDFEYVLESNITRAWFEDNGELVGKASDDRWAMFNLITPRQVYARIMIDGQPVAVGRAVVERGYLGIYDIATAPNARRQGLGQAITERLMQWGQANGARSAYLMVEEINLAARSLYAKLGFQTIYAYWYRRG